MGAPAADRRPSRRPPRWQVVLAAGAALVILVGVTVLAVRGGSDTPVATGGTSTSTTSTPTATTSTPVFQAPPPRPPVTTTAEPVTTTSEPPTTTTTTSAPTSSTTAAPRPVAAEPGPTVETTDGDHGAMRAALASARTRWRTNAPSGGYTYRTRPICFCPAADNEITVGPDGRVRSQRTIEGAPEADPPTVEQLFTVLDEAVAGDAARIRASFDLRYGYPVAYFVDYDERLADEEQGREIDWLAPQ